MPEVLVVEDEEPIRRGLCDVLAFHGLSPTGVGDGTEGLREALSGRYALVVLDVMLPGIDGFTICRQLREARPGQAVLVLTARGSEADVLEGFEAGADDYVAKPFSVAQLVARVQALLRRSGGALRRFRIGGLDVDPDRLEARRGEAVAGLTARDVELLAHLAQSPGRTVSREELLQQVWGYSRTDRVETRCIDVHVGKLRRKLAELTDDAVIVTVRGMGYRCDG